MEHKSKFEMDQKNRVDELARKRKVEEEECLDVAKSVRASGASPSLGVMWQYGDERPVASTRTMSVPYGVCCSSA